MQPYSSPSARRTCRLPEAGDPCHATRLPRVMPTGKTCCASSGPAKSGRMSERANHITGQTYYTIGDSTLMLHRAYAWLLRSGIQEPGGGVARYYRTDVEKNAPVSTE